MRYSRTISGMCLLLAFVSFSHTTSAAERTYQKKLQTLPEQTDTAAAKQKLASGVRATGGISTVSNQSSRNGVVLLRSAFISAGVADSSTHYRTTSTAGPTTAGRGSSPNYQLSQGMAPVFGCCTGTSGNVNMAGIVDLTDLSALVSYLTGGGYFLPCQAEANVNATGIVDLGDLSALVSYLTGGGYLLPNCP